MLLLTARRARQDLLVSQPKHVRVVGQQRRRVFSPLATQRRRELAKPGKGASRGGGAPDYRGLPLAFVPHLVDRLARDLQYLPGRKRAPLTRDDRLHLPHPELKALLLRGRQVSRRRRTPTRVARLEH